MAPPSGKRLKRGDLVTTELTPCVDGYYAQICRTLVVGEPNADQAAFALYREAMEAGIAAVRDGITAADIARAENDVFRRHGLGDYVTDQYTRVRGHGVGLFADSKPHILEDVTTRIDAGMTLIVHPNTYHPVVGYMVLGDVVVATGTAARCSPQRRANCSACRPERNPAMRRGLMGWNAKELPREALEERIARLRAAMASGGLDGFILYTNLVQPSAVTYLTGFTPYWSDGLLLVPKSGAPVFATALSKRVANWIASTNPLSEIVNTPKPGAAGRAVGGGRLPAGRRSGIGSPPGRALRRDRGRRTGGRAGRRQRRFASLRRASMTRNAD